FWLSRFESLSPSQPTEGSPHRPHSLAVRTLGSHPRNPGSIPGGVTPKAAETLPSFLVVGAARPSRARGRRGRRPWRAHPRAAGVDLAHLSKRSGRYAASVTTGSNLPSPHESAVAELRSVQATRPRACP